MKPTREEIVNQIFEIGEESLMIDPPTEGSLAAFDMVAGVALTNLAGMEIVRFKEMVDEIGYIQEQYPNA